MHRIKIACLASSLLLAPLAVAPSASADADATTETSTVDPVVDEPDVTETNQTLEAAAKALAEAVSSPDIRQTLHAAVDERFDGDTEALWSSLSDDPTFQTEVAAGAGEGQSAKAALSSALELEAATDALPRLQVAVPEHFESWDPATYTPLVAYMPEGVDDLALDTVTAYDAEGNAVTLDAQVAPEVPVIVVGMNERTDAAGNLNPDVVDVPDAPEEPADSLAKTNKSSSTASLAAASYQVRMILIYLRDDKEPWTKGDAEISMKAKSRGCSGVEYSDNNWTGLNNSGDAWQGARDLGNTSCDVVIYWWEDDGGSYDFELSYSGFKLGVQMDDGDDLIGGKQFPHATFAGTGSLEKGDWSALYNYVD